MNNLLRIIFLSSLLYGSGYAASKTPSLMVFSGWLDSHSESDELQVTFIVQNQCAHEIRLPTANLSEGVGTYSGSDSADLYLGVALEKDPTYGIVIFPDCYFAAVTLKPNEAAFIKIKVHVRKATKRLRLNFEITEAASKRYGFYQLSCEGTIDVGNHVPASLRITYPEPN